MDIAAGWAFSPLGFAYVGGGENTQVKPVDRHGRLQTLRGLCIPSARSVNVFMFFGKNFDRKQQNSQLLIDKKKDGLYN